MPNDDLEITGLTEACDFLDRLPRALMDAGLQPALIAGSVPIQRELRSRTPRRKQAVHGTREFPPLEKSIVTAVRVSSDGRSGVASTGFGEAGPVALWQEEGHRIVTHDGQATGQFVPPNPFMSATTIVAAEPAIDAVADSLAGTLEALTRG